MFDTNSVVSALIFPAGRRRWLLGHWRGRQCTTLVSKETAAELSRVLTYPKFRLESAERIELLADYLPFCEIVDVTERHPQVCRDKDDQTFLDLAHSGKADVLVTGDSDLLELASSASFSILSPETYRIRFSRE